MEYVPPIFVINLDRSAERLKLCEYRLKNVGFHFERITAVNGAELSTDELSQHYCKKQNQESYYKELTLGEVGCYLSHRKVWQKIVDTGIEYAIILEDDFFLMGDIEQTIKTLNKIEFDWDYIKLSGYKNRSREIAFRKKVNDMELVLFDKAMAGTCAQAVSLKGAKKLLTTSTSFGRPVDTDIQHWWEKDVELFALLPYLFAPDMELESEIAKIQPKKKQNKQYFWKRKWQQLKFMHKNKLERKRLIERLSC